MLTEQEHDLDYLESLSGLELDCALVAVTELELLGAIKTTGPQYSLKMLN